MQIKGVIGMLFVFLIALLGAYAGASGTSLAFRRLGIPFLAGVYSALKTGDWKVGLVFLIWIAFLSMGYGKPDENDSGSFLGRIFKRDCIIRPVIACLLALPTLVFVKIGTISFLSWYVATNWLIIIWGLFGGDDVIDKEGKIRFLGKDLLVEDLVVYGMLGLYNLILVGGGFLF